MIEQLFDYYMKRPEALPQQFRNALEHTEISPGTGCVRSHCGNDRFVCSKEISGLFRSGIMENLKK